MSFFRPHKSKPRQFNYVPRYYDPVKEEREHRRRELHGTSSADDEEYTPGKYIRTQREARDAAREGAASEGFRKVRNLVFVAIIVVVAALLLYPRIMRFVVRANEEKLAQQQGSVVKMPADSLQWQGIVLDERHADIDFREFESLSPELINEMEEWNSQHPNITIYSDDVKIENYKRVEK